MYCFPQYCFAGVDCESVVGDGHGVDAFVVVGAAHFADEHRSVGGEKVEEDESVSEKVLYAEHLERVFFSACLAREHGGAIDFT